MSKTTTSLKLLTETISAKTTPAQLTAIKEIGYTISKSGLALGDAALLARVTIEELNEWSKNVPEITTYFKLKTTEYKFNLLKIINDQAIENADVKQATWLLEQHFAEDFNPTLKKEIEKAKRADGTGDDIFEMAVALIRKKSAHNTPIEHKQQQVEMTEPKQITAQRVHDILS